MENIMNSTDNRGAMHKINVARNEATPYIEKFEGMKDKEIAIQIRKLCGELGAATIVAAKRNITLTVTVLPQAEGYPDKPSELVFIPEVYRDTREIF
jgi:hypothetical protein